MKLNKIAVAVAGLVISAAAWSYDTPIYNPGETLPVGTVITPGDPSATPPIPAVTVTNGGSAAAANLPNGSTASTTTPLADTLGLPVTATRADVSTATGSQKVSTFTTPTNGTDQGTVGGPGGVSGLGVDASAVTITRGAATNPTAGTSVASGTTYAAGSVIGGVTYGSAGTLSKAVTAVAGDVVYAQVISAATVTRLGTGIGGTDHDFTKKSGNTGNVGLCTFCHTPHKGTTTLLLWNHTMSSQNFAWDVAATTAGTALPGFTGNTYKGPSAKCLACHDGTIAIGDIGWFNQTARNTAGTNMNADKITKDSKLMALAGNSAGNLTGVHPVAIPYPLNGAPNVYNGSTSGARLATNDFVTDPTANNIRLYSDVGGGQIVGKVKAGATGMECSSCHDVHNKAATDRFFLRGKLVGSTKADGYICAQCHSK